MHRPSVEADVHVIDVLRRDVVDFAAACGERVRDPARNPPSGLSGEFA